MTLRKREGIGILNIRHYITFSGGLVLEEVMDLSLDKPHSE
jgi:hypothetical protein